MMDKYRILSGSIFLILLTVGGFYLGTRQITQPREIPRFYPVDQDAFQEMKDIAANKIPLPTPDETANWKTYRDETVGFEFKYPPETRIEGSQIRKDFIRYKSQEKYEENIRFQLEIENKNNFLDLENYFTNKYCYYLVVSELDGVLTQNSDCLNLFNETKKITSIDSRQALTANISYGYSGMRVTVIDIKNYIIIFNLNEFEEGAGISQKTINIFDQILSTFNFLGSTNF